MIALLLCFHAIHHALQGLYLLAQCVHLGPLPHDTPAAAVAVAHGEVESFVSPLSSRQ
jgi:hypothetical protein